MYPKFAEIDGIRYPINTDFRVAIKCNEIAEDETIGDLERGLAVIYLLFGEKGIELTAPYEKLLEMAKKYLSCGKEIEITKEKPDMDFVEDYSYIKTSFRSDYGIKLDEENIHWWEFMDLMNGLSNSEMGNCCILNRIRNLRNFDVKEIKDEKERRKIIEAKKKVELKKYKPKVEHTEEQIKRVNELLEKIGIGRSD